MQELSIAIDHRSGDNIPFCGHPRVDLITLFLKTLLIHLNSYQNDMLLPDETYEDYEEKLNFRRIFTKDIKDSKANLKLLANRANFITSPDVVTQGGGLTQRDHDVNSVSFTSGSYEYNTDFFNNIPDFMGETFPPCTFEHQCSDGRSDTATSRSNSDIDSNATSEVLRICKDFLWRHRMRPDFFCQYHKAISATSKQTKSKDSKTKERTASTTTTVDSAIASQQVPTPTPLVATLTTPLPGLVPQLDKVERFAKLSAIYTLPLAKRKKLCNNLATTAVSGELPPALTAFWTKIILIVATCK
ncbi:uncharacterized protein LOC119688392 [Teleopsis dalmanni]|uniref:uncharacterized protein LOC119688392 n=1 Tax=Teleopsis dalmanni TaxID=139649 RepID=UPI0018CF9CE9|nr:uncharacterized protein LOC119688392 [Teleopsis dalmanni]